MTTTTSRANAASPRGPRFTVPQRIMLLTGTMAVVTAVLFVVVVRSLPGAPTALNLPWVLWAAACAAAESLVVPVQWQREAHTFSMGALVLGAGLLLASPHELVLAQLLGGTLILLLRRRQRR